MPNRAQADNDSERRSDGGSFRSQHWRFDKRLSFDTIIGIMGVALVLGGPILVWGRAMEGRVQALEVIQDQRSKQETNRDLDNRDQRIAMLARMDKLDDQVTQLRIELGRLGIVPIKQR